MAQNIYDNSDFFAGYSQLPRQVHGLGGAPEWPAIRAMLPALTGKRVADLGCGFGWASLWIHAQGAASVLGLDLSQNMIARAKADNSDPAIEYRIVDLEMLELPEAAFDLVYSALDLSLCRRFPAPCARNPHCAGSRRRSGLHDRASDLHGCGASALDRR